MRMYLISGFSILLMLSSCLTIVQPLITQNNIITDNRIEGLWNGSDSKTILIQKFKNSKFKNIFTDPEMKDKDWKYTREDSIFITKHYVISFRENNLDYTWLAGIAKISDQYYLNLLPEECLNNKGEKEYDLGKVTSSIAKLKWENNNTLTICFLNGDYIKEIILDDKVRIRHEYDPLFGTFVITASSTELEQFLEKYGNNESLYKGSDPIIIRRKI